MLHYIALTHNISGAIESITESGFEEFHCQIYLIIWRKRFDDTERAGKR